MENKETFSYTYSAKEQEEIKKIREKYVPKESDKMEQLRRLDAGVTKKGTVISLVVGIIGALVLGVGMSMCMVWTEMFVLGIIVGIIGIAAVSLAYPIYSYVTKKEREKISPEIIRLTDELMK
ncbi:MAG: hypothetical protein IJY73_10650 [Oscillospiraceae bacterium]|nr:hypothetical protein [Oscillospiraceae bacterium]MBQ8904720.1 hypothetical protein [Oscillospiraceae bacterium]